MVNTKNSPVATEYAEISIGERLRQRRDEVGWTKAHLTRLAGLRTHTTISEIESGKSKDSPQIAQIAAALGVEAIWLQFGTGAKLKGERSVPTMSEIAIVSAKAIDSLPQALQKKILKYIQLTKNIHEMDTELQIAMDNQHIVPIDVSK